MKRRRIERKRDFSGREEAMQEARGGQRPPPPPAPREPRACSDSLALISGPVILRLRRQGTSCGIKFRAN